MFSSQSIAPVVVATSASPTPTPPALKTWRDRVQEVARSGGSQDLFQGKGDRPFLYPKDYELPEEYYNGLAYYIMGASGESYIIYKQGLSAPPLPREWWGSTIEIESDVAEAALRSGQAISLSQSMSAGTFSTLTPPGSDQFLVFNADEADISQVTFLEQGISLKSTTLSVEEMKRILRSGKPIPVQP
ncbi:hypothetical protein H6F67_09770 [Microcoleus sp. FACHB-1515]|uniref:hypothetical protein n=1 Tax=Cyanophyceae TaxID=3028117 RepID=UPI0016887F12|nr:hypothetical protein [Microcoleus sp. FACHB-1515]MBD2090140.1 hypothetical protein [Microcoleus sp. FACHB-1515]